MEALTELCDLIAKKPAQFTEKLGWICGHCPSPEFFSGGSPRISRSQLNSVICVSRFLSLCPSPPDHRPKDVVLDFLCSVTTSFQLSFWPQSFHNDAVSTFYADFLGYVCIVGEISPEFSDDVENFFGEVVMSALNNAYSVCSESRPISRIFLVALSNSFPRISPYDSENLIILLLEQICAVSPFSPRDAASGGGGMASGMSSY
ncbi:hypothetical protein RND81_02G188200 [Saponaria officinalis]|uniref:Uncharacterized protein n=1 Tax=Saponaria officinalis TaxID=3572 RepID=A0AAW1MS24_SAPOF